MLFFFCIKSLYICMFFSLRIGFIQNQYKLIKNKAQLLIFTFSCCIFESETFKNRIMKTLRINEEKLKTVVLEAVKEMINFEWSGWKIDVLATEEGEIFCSSKNTNNYYRNATVLFSVESVVYNKEEWSSENDCAYESMLWYIDNFNEMLIDCDLEIILES